MGQVCCHMMEWTAVQDFNSSKFWSWSEYNDIYSRSAFNGFYRDNVEWDSEQEQAAQQKINENSNIKVGEDKQGTEMNLFGFAIQASNGKCL